MRMRLSFLSFLAFAAAPALGGCSSYPIRPGIWEMSFQNVARVDTGDLLELPRHEVSIAVAHETNEQKPEVTEIAEIVYLGKPGKGSPGEGAMAMPPKLYAEIITREEKDIVFRVNRSQDQTWAFTLLGVVENDQLIRGTRIDARIREQNNIAFHGGQGSWILRWIRNE